MNVAIVHYHLNRGGVTHVVVNQLRAIEEAAAASQRVRAALLYGGRREGLPTEHLSRLEHLDVSLHEVPALDYDDRVQASPAALFGQIRRVLDGIGFSPAGSLLHIHNHSLGKNMSVPGAVSLLAGDGYPIVLEIHDFPEDFRPGNYRRLITALAPEDPEQLPAVLYPQARQLHYAVLNRRDFAILQRAGVPPGNLHLVPNPVPEFGALPPKREARKKLARRFAVAEQVQYLLYPVRGIRRKNLGEALLWSVLAGKTTTVGFTLPPINPIEQPSYRRWKQLAEKLSLRCVFETGSPGGLDFRENLAAADLLLTTSVAEGFGMVFLESWLAGRRLVGRDLPEITSDFVQAGIRLDGLHPRLLVPIDWVGRAAFRAAMEAALAKAHAGCGGPASVGRARLARQLDSLTDIDKVDFAALSSSAQQQIVQRTHEDPMRRSELLELNPWIPRALSGGQAGEEWIRRNAEAVRATYSLQASGRRLLDLYERVLASPRDASVGRLKNGAAVLDALLDLSRLHPIRLEP